MACCPALPCFTSLNAMRRHFPTPEDNFDVKLVVKSMGSLLSGTTDPDSSIRPLHGSLRNFLMDERSSGEFFVDLSNAQCDLAFVSLQMMKHGLCFNICDLNAVGALKGHPEFKDVSLTAVDVQRFIQVFSSIILHSTPHLYVSACPFSPVNSPLSRMFPNTLHLAFGRDMNWPAVQTVLRGHTKPVTSVSFSPDGMGKPVDGYAQAMPAKYTILALPTFILSHNQWCKGLRDVSNNVMNARRERQAPQPPPAPHAQSEAPLLDKPSLNEANQPEFENPEPYELPVHHSPSPPPLARASGLPNHRWQLPSRYQDELPALPIPVPIPPPVDDVAHTIPQSPVHSDSGTAELEGDVPTVQMSGPGMQALADEDSDSKLFSTSDKWHEASVNIKLPAEKHRYASEADAPDCAMDGLYYRKPLEVIRSAYEEVASKSFHNVLYKLFWQPDEGEFPECVIMKVYMASAMLDEHEKIKAQPHEPGCRLETIVTSIMLWSDSMHLASFGHAVLWPIYMFIGNQSNIPGIVPLHSLPIIWRISQRFAYVS
ncbi:hypothetical protein DFJ58DRAFT_734023 [Suillus subalutaceus]|uniref:uncharacterized protein n=1 Tax=Suillus subalutaceus TaxID=48586 RepID=UPI001B866EC3|nr:uncharacterized protein DFJ58DRAFT_734023 [Suillus subalutaceus]KAG1838102.1 hypothetical protein DFJ58DRAFT_734023 [Suillus subalutaceus]